VAIVVTGCLLTRLAAHYFKIINIKFRTDNEVIPAESETQKDMEQPKNSS